MAKAGRRAGNLPAETTSFVGRRRQLAEIRKKLGEARLVTLVGPGGVGKTRLALRAAHDLGRGFRDGAWLVELAEVQDPSLVGNALTAALGLRDQAASEPRSLLLSFLSDRQLLLVIDNCEHLLQPVTELVMSIIEAARDVRVIATSREPLSIAAETLVAVPPLDLPSAGRVEPLARIQQNEAVTLFVERAAASVGGFTLTAENGDAVVELCRRLDGLPLAIELAAVRTRVLDPKQIVERLAARFDLLTRGSRGGALPRHQTLRTTIDWSYDLLSVREQTLLSQLCVFGGRFTLEDVEGIGVTGALEGMSSLVDKSLAIKEEVRGTACFRLHETMREYARLKLREAGEEQAVEDRCADHYLHQALRFGPDPREHLLQWLTWADLEIDNMRSVLRRNVTQHDFSRGIALATSLGWYWITRATSEGVRWLDQLLLGADLEPRMSALACFLRGFLAVLQGDAESAKPWLGRAIAAARQAEDASVLTHSLAMASIAHRMADERTTAATLLEEAQSAVAGAPDPGAKLAVLQAQALNGLFDGDLNNVREATSLGVQIARRANHLYELEVMLGELGGTALINDDADAAKPLYEEGLRIARKIDDRVTQFYFVDAIACIAASSGRARLAAQLLGAARSMKNAAGATALSFMAPLIEQAEEAARSALGQARFESEMEAGKRLSLETALSLALGEKQARDIPAHDHDPSLLAKREADVARLIADGLSNKEIAGRLFISQRTVDSHVRNILDKLGFNSRAQIAAWVTTSFLTESAEDSRNWPSRAN